MRRWTAIVGLGVMGGLLLARGVSAGWKVDGRGGLVYEWEKGQVLGRGSDGEGSGSGEEKRTEIRFSEGERIRTETKEGETRTEVRSGGVKVRMEQKDGRLIIKAENEAGEEETVGQQDIFKIEERLDKNQIKVATGSGDSVVFARGTIGAKTNFPLAVDLATNSLIVTTPAGTKVVTVLPDAAVANMLAANVIDRLGGRAVAEAAAAGSLSGVSQVVEMGQRQGLPVYEIAGLSDQRLLGFIAVSIPKVVVVSAETGEIVAQEQTLLNRVLDALSI